MNAQDVGWAVPTSHRQLWWAQPTLRFYHSPEVPRYHCGVYGHACPDRLRLVHIRGRYQALLDEFHIAKYPVTVAEFSDANSQRRCELATTVTVWGFQVLFHARMAEPEHG